MKMKKEVVVPTTNSKPYTRLLKGFKGISLPKSTESRIYKGLKGSLCLNEGNTESSPCLNEGDYTPHFENCSALKKDLPPYSIAPHTKLFLTKILSQPLVNQINNVTQNPFSRLKWSYLRRENSLFMPLFGGKILNFWDKNLNFYFTFKHVTN